MTNVHLLVIRLHSPPAGLQPMAMIPKIIAFDVLTRKGVDCPPVPRLLAAPHTPGCVKDTNPKTMIWKRTDL